MMKKGTRKLQTTHITSKEDQVLEQTLRDYKRWAWRTMESMKGKIYPKVHHASHVLL